MMVEYYEPGSQLEDLYEDASEAISVHKLANSVYAVFSHLIDFSQHYPEQEHERVLQFLNAPVSAPLKMGLCLCLLN